MFTAALFMVAKIRKQPKCPSIDEWIKKMWYTYIMEYYSALKKKEILPFVATCMNPEDIMLSEISQTQKDKYCLISLLWDSKNAELIVTKSRMVVTRALGMRGMGRCWSKGKNF